MFQISVRVAYAQLCWMSDSEYLQAHVLGSTPEERILTIDGHHYKCMDGALGIGCSATVLKASFPVPTRGTQLCFYKPISERHVACLLPKARASGHGAKGSFASTMCEAIRSDLFLATADSSQD